MLTTYLPTNPDYRTACHLIENKGTDYWRPVIQAIAAQHNITVDDITHLANSSNAVFKVNNDLLFKLIPPLWHDDAERELTALNILSSSRLPIQTPILIACGELDGWQYLITDLLPGVCLEQIWPSLDQQQRLRLTRQLGGFAKALNAVPVNKSLAGQKPWQQFLDHQRKHCVEKRRQQGLKEALLTKIDSYLDSVNYRCTETRLRLVHADLHPGNLLATEVDDGWQLTGVIDFGDALITPDIRFELMTPAIFMALTDATVFHTFLDSYGFTVEPADYARLQSVLTAFSIMRHTGQLNFLLTHVPGCNQLTDWQPIAKNFFPLQPK